MVQVVWTRRAADDVLLIRAYIGQFNPLAAQRMAVRLKSAGDGLEHFPERGRSIGRGRRDLTILWPYLIRYRIKNGAVEILTVRHGARQPE